MVQLKLVIDSIVWAFRHTERNVADTGLNLLLELLVMFEKSEFATVFHQTYYLQLMQEIFAVMTGAATSSIYLDRAARTLAEDFCIFWPFESLDSCCGELSALYAGVSLRITIEVPQTHQRF